jgi:hypothetical protein
MYNKLFTKILDSSIWLESDATRLVWLTLLAAMDEDGFAQFASVANLAHRARVTPDVCAEAVRCLEAPDANSGDPDHGGRRLERVDGGWVVLNAGKYRLMVTRVVAREQTRERVRKFRAKAASNAPVTVANDSVTPSEAVAVAEAVAKAEATATAPPSAPPPRRLISGEAHALTWAKIHGDHVTGFCDWVCLPEFVFAEFVRKSAGVDYVRDWAARVRQEWHGKTVGDNLKFWRVRWSETHPEKIFNGKPVAQTADQIKAELAARAKAREARA